MKAQPRKAQPSTDPFAGVPSAKSPFGKENWSFDSVLRRILGLSRAAEYERHRRRSTEEGPAIDALRVFARTLDVQILRKLETLMVAGRDGRALGPTAATLSERAPASQRTPDLFDEHLASVDNLRRGHAIACATRFDLETEVAGWSSKAGGDSLDERVWLRFARELASSNPNDWTCFAQVGRSTELEVLYLRRTDLRWWSFGTLIDRPSSRRISQRFDAAGRKRSRFVVLPVEAVVGQRCRTDRPALRRAAMAMSARLGACRKA